MVDQIVLFMRWESNLSVNDRYERGTRPKLRPECATWQEELAWEVKLLAVQARFDSLPEGVTLVVDVEMHFPDDGVARDPDNYLKSICDGLEMGLGIPDSQFIPFIRQVKWVSLPEAGFAIRVYPEQFAGHSQHGTFMRLSGGSDCIILEEPVPTAWLNQRCVVHVGMVVEEACHG
jgi:Holliday junction resolvase RusA-like endonuclease